MFIKNGKNNTGERTLITVKDLTWGYKDGVPLFKKYNFILTQGSFSVLTGPSGSGKTTLAKLMTGHISAPSKTIYHHLEDISKYSYKELQNFRKNLGLIFQKDYLISTLSVKENILYPLYVQGCKIENCMNRYREILRYLDIRDLPDKNIDHLSAGEIQKVFLARALIHKPEFVLIDDALSHLDKKYRNRILDVLIKYHRDGHTVLLITHDDAIVKYLEKNIDISLCSL